MGYEEKTCPNPDEIIYVNLILMTWTCGPVSLQQQIKDLPVTFDFFGAEIQNVLVVVLSKLRDTLLQTGPRT